MNGKPGNPLLRMEHIVKSFSGVHVLDDVDFEIFPGEVHVLAGENGAGKSTLIKILSGVHRDYEGSIRIEGKSVRFKSPSDAAVHGIATIHQEMSLVNSMNIIDNIFLGREHTRFNQWVMRHHQEQKARRILAQMELELDLSLPVGSYPLSIRQMIQIAKALAFDARIIIMDEPTSALNEVETARLFTIISKLKQSGNSIVFISHRLDEIYQIGDRISILRDGLSIGSAPAGDLSRDEMIRWMVGREIDRQFPERAAPQGNERLHVEHFSVPNPRGVHGWAVRDAELHIRAGEILGIAGLQGSGKSELLNGLFGTYGKLPQGSIRLNGKDFCPSSPRSSINRGLVLLTNDRKGTGLIPSMDISRNISLASQKAFSPHLWMETAREKDRARDHVKDLGIKLQSLTQDVQTLSGGNQQKVVLAKWLETKPKVLLLDEPTAGVDIGAKHDTYRLMNRWTSLGLAIILVTSELSELLAMSDRVIVMHRGRITAEFPRGQASQEDILQAAMADEKETA